MSEGPLRFYSAAQVREIDRRAIASGISGYALMQRAAAAAFAELVRRWPRARRVAILCGPGKNGGDGYEIARLARAGGMPVDAWQVGGAPSGGEALKARKAWDRDGGKTRVYRSQKIATPDVVVDAIFGTGLSRAPEDAAHAAIEQVNDLCRRGAGVLAVDVPSGLDSDRGVTLGAAVDAHVTVSFIGRKIGLYTGRGPDFAGTVVFDDLKVPAGAARGVGAVAEGLTRETLRQLLPPRLRSAHKGLFGHVLLVGGNDGMPGAILLAARAALRAGAGLVSVATRPANAAALSAAQPEIMAHGIDDARRLRPLLERATVVAVGPGLGTDDWSRSIWSQALSSPHPAVLDADGLKWLNSNPEKRPNWVLTPHPGEAALLLGRKSADIQADRVASASELQSRFGGAVVLKGAGTLVLGQSLALCPHGNPGMASGGMGDVLCGLVAGLLAQGLSPEHAAQAGVVAHALAGDRAAAAGERGLMPSDLLAELRPLLNLAPS